MTRTIRPGDDGYDDERTGFQAAVEHRPDVIYAAEGAADVRTAVRRGQPAAGGGEGQPATADRVREAYEPGDCERLRRLKARYDPDNMFRFNHNIPPATPTQSR